MRMRRSVVSGPNWRRPFPIQLAIEYLQVLFFDTKPITIPEGLLTALASIVLNHARP